MYRRRNLIHIRFFCIESIAQEEKEGAASQQRSDTRSDQLHRRENAARVAHRLRRARHHHCAVPRRRGLHTGRRATSGIYLHGLQFPLHYSVVTYFIIIVYLVVVDCG